MYIIKCDDCGQSEDKEKLKLFRVTLSCRTITMTDDYPLIAKDFCEACCVKRGINEHHIPVPAVQKSILDQLLAELLEIKNGI